MGFLLKLFGGNSIAMYLAIALGVVVLISGGLLKYALYTIEQKTSLITALEISNKAQKEAIAQIQEDTKAIKVINKTLTEIERANNENATNLADKLSKLDALAVDKPDLVEAMINKGSDSRIRCFEIVTGAPLVKKETNDVCPQVIERKKPK